MAWNNRQKGILAKYRRAGKFADQEYRELLYQCTGVRSSTHKGLTQHDYERVMASIETRLEYRIREGYLGSTEPSHHGIRNIRYWRKKLPQKGAINTRQRHRILDILWPELCEFLPPEQCTHEYLCGIATQACGYRVRHLHDMQAWQAACLIDALTDRIHYAVKNAG